MGTDADESRGTVLMMATNPLNCLNFYSISTDIDEVEGHSWFG